MTEDELSNVIIGLAIKVHRSLGPGLLESAYEECLFYELTKTGIKVERQKTVPLVYDGRNMKTIYRVDLMVDSKLVIEIKSVDELNNVHLAQVLTYLKFSNSRLGILINFNVQLLKHGIKRVVNNL